MAQLAIRGGPKTRAKPWPMYSVIDDHERRLVLEVLDSKLLSGFVGSYCDDFFGGPQVRALESEWKARFGVRHAVSMNSATSCLHAALAALGVGPGDEVITSAFTMSATATSIVFNNAVPVFADVESETFNLDPGSFASAITPRTKAVIVPHLFGHPAPIEEILKIARARGVRVVEDNAQSPGAEAGGRLAGTLGDIGVFSLNRHKIVQAGEGGVAVTNDDGLALRMQLVRNHGENAVAQFGLKDISNTFGWNFRMTELDAAVSRGQLAKLDGILAKIREAAKYLDGRLAGIPGIACAEERPGYRHVYLHHTILYDEAVIGVPRDRFVEAVQAEGIEWWGGYMDPLYTRPMFREKIAYGREGCPFLCPLYKGRADYRDGLCPNAERLHKVMIAHDLHRPPAGIDDCKDIADAIEKVLEHRAELAP